MPFSAFSDLVELGRREDERIGFLQQACGGFRAHAALLDLKGILYSEFGIL